MTDTETRLSNLFAEYLGTHPEERAAELGKSFDDLEPVADMGADSLDMVEITMCCEEEFGIEITDEDGRPHTDADGRPLGELVALIDRKLAEKNG